MRRERGRGRRGGRAARRDVTRDGRRLLRGGLLPAGTQDAVPAGGAAAAKELMHLMDLMRLINELDLFNLFDLFNWFVKC